jgi:hypothetical protein
LRHKRNRHSHPHTRDRQSKSDIPQHIVPDQGWRGSICPRLPYPKIEVKKLNIVEIGNADDEFTRLWGKQ